MNCYSLIFSKIRWVLFIISFFVTLITISNSFAETNSSSINVALPLSSQKNHFNRLGGEKSPYLLQHKDNPVYWYAWGSDAFNAAKNENKPIFLSVGYSTCYWCHVMEKDSFEHQDVADVLNKHFISIKVDREELPDVDSIYMDAVVALTGHGGWPMSVFLTPELKPFFGGTFFYKKQFVQLLERVSEIWINNRDHLNQSADQISNFLKDRSPTAEEDTTELKDAALVDAFKELGQSFDPVHGGFGREPKFPPSAQIGLLFRIHRRSGNVEALKMAESTLTSMSYGGIYDHLGGGFHRYSTDNAWLIPHFEKMLYDNALLANVYLEAFQVTKRPLYRSVATEVLDYILRDMTDPDGGFYSAEDAGEVGREGEYYVWKEEELKNTLGAEDFEMLQKSYDISIQGNFEHGTNILSFNKNTSWEIKSEPKLKKIHDALFVLRSKRTRPLRDDKVLTAWNGLMIAAMAKAHQVVGEGKYKKAAKASAEFIKTKLWKNGQLLRRYRDEDARFSGSLDDYAFLIHGLISLYESTFENQWLDWAIQLQKTQDRLFWDVKDGGYFISSAEDNSLLYRKKTFVDGAIPSGNSISALNLLRLHGFTAEENYKETATTLLKLIVSESRRAPSAFATGLAALDYYLDFAKEIVVVGHLTSQAAVDFRHFLYQSFLPSKVIAYGEATSWDDETSLPVFRGKKLFNNLTTFYICEDNTCKSPTTDISTAKQLTETFSPFNF